jgi:hypothetical protein
MKHEIEIPDFPDGWEAVAYRVPKAGECYFGSSGIKLALKDFENLWLVVRKKQPRRIVFWKRLMKMLVLTLQNYGK